jgi:hypothetical protein
MKLNQKLGLAARLLTRNPGELCERGINSLQSLWGTTQAKSADQTPITFEDFLEQLRR